jgi:hypothetical protein
MNFKDFRQNFIDLSSHSQYLENAGGAEIILNILL